MTTINPDEPVGYDGFGAPIYAHALGSVVGHAVDPLAWVADYDAEHDRDTIAIQSWGAAQPTLILEIKEMNLEVMHIFWGCDPRPPLAEQAIPAKGQE